MLIIYPFIYGWSSGYNAYFTTDEHTKYLNRPFVDEPTGKYGKSRKEYYLNGVNDNLTEEKPSSGLTKKQKSDVVKKAKSGKDIGKTGKVLLNFIQLKVTQCYLDE